MKNRNESTRPAERVFLVKEITRHIKAVLERSFGRVWVEGEISNQRSPSSGHLYFTLKDAESQIGAVMFRGRAAGLTFQPVDGQVVRVLARISVYEPQGNYQLVVDRMEAGGKGALQQQFEALKAKLLEEGLFEESRKRALPLLPRRIGVVTSPTGAAIRDILNVLDRRFRNVHVVLAPVLVQGKTAAPSIARAIQWFDQKASESLRPDVLIVGRGGGSLEDLWCFNAECVARAISACRIPVISAVGHEIDFTISDFVADLRAPTPSAAAERVVGCKDAFEERLQGLQATLDRTLRHRMAAAKGRLAGVRTHHVFRKPGHLVERLAQQLDGADLKMQHALVRCRDQARGRLEHMSGQLSRSIAQSSQLTREQLNSIERRLSTAAASRVELAQGRLRADERQLVALSPLGVLARGFSLTRKADGSLVRSPADVEKGDHLLTTLSDGRLDSVVDAVAKDDA